MVEANKSIRASLAEIFPKWGHLRVNGRVASDRTCRHREEVTCMAFDDLSELGFKIQKPENFADRHVEALVQHWYSKGLMPKTILGYMTVLRLFARAIGKPGLVRPLHVYLPDVDPAVLKVKAVAAASKSWTAAGINLVEVFERVDQYDFRLGLMLRMELQFGLRRKEALLMQPWVAHQEDVLIIFPGQGKGTRPRAIPIETEPQRALLEYVKQHVKKTETLGWPVLQGERATYKRQINRYKNSMATLGLTKAEIGVTGHGLRAQYAENFELLHEHIPAVLGGSKGSETATQDDNEVRYVMRRQESEALGHSRTRIVSAYTGQTSPDESRGDPVVRSETIGFAATLLRQHGLDSPVAPERVADCALMVMTLRSHAVDVEPNIVQTLWQLHSERHAVEWMVPTTGVAQAIEVAARLVIMRLIG